MDNAEAIKRIAQYLELLSKDKFFGKVGITFFDGRIKLVDTFENFKPEDLPIEEASGDIMNKRTTGIHCHTCNRWMEDDTPVTDIFIMQNPYPPCPKCESKTTSRYVLFKPQK